MKIKIKKKETFEEVTFEEMWFAILGTKCGIVSIHLTKEEAIEERNMKGYGKENKIVPCTVTFKNTFKK